MSNDDEGTIDLRREKEDSMPEFRIDDIDDDDEFEKKESFGNVEVAALSELDVTASKASDKVKVKFDKFVNLIATHAYEDVIEKHVDQDVVISTDLLTDLANAHEEKQDKKMPLIFLVGIVLGIVFTWIILKT